MVLKVQLEEELELKFREAAMRKFGYAKGSIQKAVRDAFQIWIKDQAKFKKPK